MIFVDMKPRFWKLKSKKREYIPTHTLQKGGGKRTASTQNETKKKKKKWPVICLFFVNES